MALNTEETELLNFAIAALPPWFVSNERALEELYGFAKMFGGVRAVVVYWFQQTLIGGANGPETGLPDWLNQHAIDHGTRRQLDETTEALRIRLRNVPEAITRASLLAAAQAIVDEEGIGGTVAMVELPRDGAHFGTWGVMSGIGGEFSDPDTAGVQQFTPTAGWATPPVDSTHTNIPWDTWRLTTANSAESGNDVVTDIDSTGADDPRDIIGNAVQFSNPLGVASVDSGVEWTAERYVHAPWIATGVRRAFLGRGYRMSRTRPLTIVLILPYGSTAGTATAVREMLRQKKAAGIVTRIERRLVP